MARHGRRRAGRWPVQIRFEITLTGEQYVSHKAWLKARLEACPLHPRGGCGFARHGTYARRRPPGTRIARWYCPLGHRTFSLLPDCLATALPGTLEELEAVVVAVEQAKSLAAAADTLRPDIELPGAMRWVRRRVKAVQATLPRLKGLFPEVLAGCALSVRGVSQAFAITPLLPAMRAQAADWLAELAPPLGLAPRAGHGGEPRRRLQHAMGPDPPTPLL